MLFPEVAYSEFRPCAVVDVAGDDAFTFLQGQFTNELRQVAGHQAYGLWLEQKGKVLGDSHVLRVSEKHFMLFSVHTSADVLIRRLEAYIVADDVTLVDHTAQHEGWVLFGPRAGERLEGLLGARPAENSYLRVGELTVFGGRRAPGESFELFGPAHAINKIRQKLRAAGAQAVAAEQLEWARIEAGIPAIPADVGPADLPNEAGLDASAISYTKGCYLGQEVMARLKNLGQVRRRLRVVHGRGPSPARHAALFQGEKKVGEVRSSARRGDEFIAFAMLSLINFESGTGLALEPAGPATMTADRHG